MQLIQQILEHFDNISDPHIHLRAANYKTLNPLLILIYPMFISDLRISLFSVVLTQQTVNTVNVKFEILNSHTYDNSLGIIQTVQLSHIW